MDNTLDIAILYVLVIHCTRRTRSDNTLDIAILYVLVIHCTRRTRSGQYTGHRHPIHARYSLHEEVAGDVGGPGKANLKNNMFRIQPQTLQSCSKIFVFKPWVISFFFNLKSSKLSQSALSAKFEYLCYWSTAIINILTLSARGRQILTSEDEPPR